MCQRAWALLITLTFAVSLFIVVTNIIGGGSMSNLEITPTLSIGNLTLKHSIKHNEVPQSEQRLADQ